MQPFSPFVDGYYDTGSQMAFDLRRRAEVHFRRREREWEAIASVAQFEAHRERVRQAFLDAIGGLPGERCGLQAECTGVLDRGAFHIEKVVYQSLPGFHVTASLYVPHGLAAPTAAVLLLCGHSEQGKAEPRYQAVCADLAANGVVAMAIDPMGQGERLQYYERETGTRVIGGCTTEHTYTGLQMTLRGESIARYFIWDAMRALDYLCSRPEVDPARIGVTGNSGGGTQTCLLLMSGEPRIAAAAPCCFVMTLESYLKIGQAQDAEQLVRGCFAQGPDHHEFVTAIAPRPVLIGAALSDFFPIEGAREALRRAKHAYRLYGAEGNVDIAYSPHAHGFSSELREAVVNWMRSHLLGLPGDFVTDEPEVLPTEALNCLAQGQVLAAYPAGRTIADINRASVDKQPPSAPREPSRLRAALAATLGVPADDVHQPVDARVVWEETIEGYASEHVFFFSAPDVIVAGVMIHPRGGQVASRTNAVLLPGGTADMDRERARLEAMLAEGRRLFVFDPRGIGVVQAHPINPHPLWDDYGTEYRLASDAMMLGISTLGLRVFDVLRALAYLRGRQDVSSVGIYGLGFGALLAYLAAALDGKLASVTVEDMLYSYADLAGARHYDRRQYGAWCVAWGILKVFDLPDLLPCIAPAELRLINPRDALGRHADGRAVEELYLRSRPAGESGGAWRPRVWLTSMLAPDARCESR